MLQEQQTTQRTATGIAVYYAKQFHRFGIPICVMLLPTGKYIACSEYDRVFYELCGSKILLTIRGKNGTVSSL